MLGEYIKAATGKRHIWGEHDCSTFCADWRVLQGHSDPMADIRGEYHGEQSGLELIELGGGLLELWSNRMPVPVENPSAGAIGCLNVSGQIMGIFTGERWIVLLEIGIRGIQAPASKILRAWNG